MQEVKLWTTDDKGQKVPYVCKDCGRQRIGLILNVITKTVLPCECKPR